eukprot:4046529-Prymnesium_polylepis.1
MATLCPAFPKRQTHTSRALHSTARTTRTPGHSTGMSASIGGFSTRASPANAPAERHLHAHSD